MEIDLKLLPIDSIVAIRDHRDLEGRINAIKINRGNTIDYEIAYWDKNDYKLLWLASDEIESSIDRKDMSVKFWGHDELRKKN